jgi:hypothetical protein
MSTKRKQIEAQNEIDATPQTFREAIAIVMEALNEWGKIAEELERSGVESIKVSGLETAKSLAFDRITSNANRARSRLVKARKERADAINRSTNTKKKPKRLPRTGDEP